MRPKKIEEQELLLGLMRVFQSKGFEGASLNELSSATGLKKASLYHRFPGGKDDMALAVVDFVDNWIQINMLEVLANKSLNGENKLQFLLNNLTELYQEGTCSCILRVFSLDLGMNLFGEKIKMATEKFLKGFFTLGIELGKNEVQSNQLAIDAFIKIQGGLILSKIQNDKNMFLRVINELEFLYLSD